MAEYTRIQFRSYQRFEHGEQSVTHAQMKSGLALCAFLDIDPYKLCFGMSREEYLRQAGNSRIHEKIEEIRHP